MEFDLRRYWRLLLKWWWLLAIGTIVPMVVSYRFTAQEQPLYQARTILMVGTTLQSADPDPGEIGLAERLARGYAAMVSYHPVTNEVIRKLGLKQLPVELAEQIVAFVRPEANLLEIWVTDTNPRAAALIANALADELIRQSPGSGTHDKQQRFIGQQLDDLGAKIEQIEQEIEERTAALVNLTSAAEIQVAQDHLAGLESIASRYRSEYALYLQSFTDSSVNQLAIVEPAVEPEFPMGSKRKLVLAVAGAAGLGLALGAVFLMEYFDDTVRWEGDQAQKLAGMPVLGALARMPNSKGAIIARGTERSPESEAIRNLRTNLFLSRRRESYRSVLITSAGNREGKSFVTANLAVSFAAAGLSTVLVDGDLRRPTQHAIFDLPNFFGLADLLNRGAPPEEVVSGKGLQSTVVPNLSLLSAGRHPPDPAILLNSPNLALLMRALEERADIVLVDSPPVLAVPDTTLLASECNATLLVVNDGVATRTEVNKAKKELFRYEVNLVGGAFNSIKHRGRSSQPYYYYRYGTSDRRSPLTRLWTRLSITGTNGRAGDDPERLLGLREMAAYLGIEPRTARRWCKDRRIPALKRNFHWYVRRGDLQAMVTRQLLGEPEDGSVGGAFASELAPPEAIAMLEPTLPGQVHRNQPGFP
jgi:succinoglycan biosynthesis transport protein ExoP